MYKRIIVPTDGSEITEKAVSTAVALAKLTGASLVTLCVKEPFPYSAISEMQPVPPQEFYDAQERIAAERVKVVLAAAAAAGVACAGRQGRASDGACAHRARPFLRLAPSRGQPATGRPPVVAWVFRTCGPARENLPP